MYVVRVYQGAVCFWKNTYSDWVEAVMTFGNYRDSLYSHIVLEVFSENFTETWVKLAPFPKHWSGNDIWPQHSKGGDKNE